MAGELMGRRVLALDLGSSSVRAIVFESHGAGHLAAVDGAVARRPRHLNSQEPGQATFDPRSYVSDLVDCIDELNAKGLLEGVDDVAADSQWHSVLPVDRHGSPMGELVAWADTRALPGGPHVGHGTGGDREALRQRTGCVVAPMYWTCRIPWLLSAGAIGQREVPQLYLGLSEFLGLQLLGDPSMSVSMASATGLLATASHAWDAEALEVAGITAAFLPPIATANWRGRLSPPWQERWPGLAGASWHPVLGDGAAATLGVGCNRAGRAAITVGTSAAVRVVTAAAPERSALPAGLWRYCVDARRDVVGAAFSSGGQLYSWALSLWEGAATASGRAPAGPAPGQVRYDLEVPVRAGSEGVLVLPWHAGTRPPADHVPAGQGCVVGLGLGHGGAHVVSAAAEAVCFQLADGLEQLESLGLSQSLGPPDRRGPAPLEVIVNGGAIERSPWWQKRLAAVLARSVLCAAVPETTARGAAANALGVDLGQAEMDGHRVDPEPPDLARLAKARRRWQRWYQAVLPVAAADAGPQGLETDWASRG